MAEEDESSEWSDDCMLDSFDLAYGRGAFIDDSGQNSRRIGAAERLTIRVANGEDDFSRGTFNDESQQKSRDRTGLGGGGGSKIPGPKNMFVDANSEEKTPIKSNEGMPWNHRRDLDATLRERTACKSP